MYEERGRGTVLFIHLSYFIFLNKREKKEKKYTNEFMILSEVLSF